MSRARVDAFEAWLRATGTPAEVALFSRSIAEGFIAVAGAGPVTAVHVELSCKLARDAGMDVSAMEQLGALFVRFAESAPPAPPVSVRAKSVPPIGADITPVPVRAKSAPPVEPEVAVPAPEMAAAAAPDLVVSFRAATPVDAIVRADTTPPPAAVETVEASPPPPRRRTRRETAAGRRVRVYLAAAVLAIGGVAAWLAHGGSPASAPDADAPDHVRRLARLGLDAAFPDGWRVAPDPQPLGALTATLVSHGSAGNPDDSAFIATLPLTDALADGTAISDDDLVRAAQRAEHGTASRLAADGGTYLTGGCQLATIGTSTSTRTAVCRGTVHDGRRTLALQTYLRVGEARAVVALFVAKLTVADPAREADQIVGSLGL